MRIGVLLNGCGHRDGSEIHEAVLTLLGLEEAGAEPVCFAPDLAQAQVLNHQTGAAMPVTRNMLQESARIARGKISPLSNCQISELSGLVIPGGSGTASNLCNFATAGQHMQVIGPVAGLLVEFHAARKPIGAVCISPIVLAKVFGASAPKLTLGSADLSVNPAAAAATTMGAKMEECAANACVVDPENRLVSTPAYMLDAKISEIRQGIAKLCAEVVRLAR